MIAVETTSCKVHVYVRYDFLEVSTNVDVPVAGPRLGRCNRKHSNMDVLVAGPR